MRASRSSTARKNAENSDTSNQEVPSKSTKSNDVEECMKLGTKLTNGDSKQSNGSVSRTANGNKKKEENGIDNGDQSKSDDSEAQLTNIDAEKSDMIAVAGEVSGDLDDKLVNGDIKKTDTGFANGDAKKSHFTENGVKSNDRDTKLTNGGVKKSDTVLANGDGKDPVENGVRRKARSEIKMEYDDFSDDDTFVNGRGCKRRIKSSCNETSSDEEKVNKKRGSKKAKVEAQSTKERRKNSTIPRCTICLQILDNPDLLYYTGHPVDAEDELTLLTKSELNVMADDASSSIHESPERKITAFTVYDQNGHLCRFDQGLVEKGAHLYFSGYVKAIYDESADIANGFPAFDIGPIIGWWISGYDGGQGILIGLSTDYCDYYLMKPSEMYAPLMKEFQHKAYLSKLVIELLEENSEASEDDLLDFIQDKALPTGMQQYSADSLVNHAEFVVDQVQSYDDAAVGDDDIPKLMNAPCMQALVEMAGVQISKKKVRQPIRGIKKKEAKPKIPAFVKATTTHLVQNVFESFFPDQLDKVSTKVQGPRKTRCGMCDYCQASDCGKCAACRDMIKFCGSGKSKQACILRKCPNMALKEDLDDDTATEEEEVEGEGEALAPKKKYSEVDPCHLRSFRFTQLGASIEWVGDAIKEEVIGKKIDTYYSSVLVKEEKYSVGDFVLVEPDDDSRPHYIAKIIYMWQTTKEEDSRKVTKFKMDSGECNKFFHALFFYRGSETVLGETANPQELFLSDDCENCNLTCVRGKAKVTYKPAPDNWASLGNSTLEQLGEDCGPDDETTFFYQMKYEMEHCRFLSIRDYPACSRKSSEHRYCGNCEQVFVFQQNDTPIAENRIKGEKGDLETKFELVKWKGQVFRPDNCVFLSPGILKFRSRPKKDPNSKNKPKLDDYDEDMYPELYRKKSDHVKGSNSKTPEPFGIGCIVSISAEGSEIALGSNITLRVKKLYRPHNTHKSDAAVNQADLNLLYWSDEEVNVGFADVMGKCYVACSENLNELPSQWTKEGPYRFYYNEGYNASDKLFYDLPNAAKRLGLNGKINDKRDAEEIPKWPEISRPLRSMDVFAGCGGLSEGLHQSGAATSRWAIEIDASAADAFKTNNSNCTVYMDDCNEFLKSCIENAPRNAKGQRLPTKGEIELLVGGPPCQGFSGMNRFNSREYSKFRNCLVVTYLSICDYFRPRFFVLENVRNFASFKKSMVLKLTMRCLVRMGYQCTFGVMQAGNYGVPQTRRRVIIMAAAPGEILPLYPEPTHAFCPRATKLTVCMDGLKKFTTNCEWTESAPYRTITVRDALGELPPIESGSGCEEMSYGGEPLSHFQRMVRSSVLRDHMCKQFAPLINARMEHIPIYEGADWRDLPNIVLRLPDGSYSKKLQYTHHDKKMGKSGTGSLRGVCSCASGKPCDPLDKQYDTLVPWCLPHTGNRHNHWAGLYGRLQWDGFFSTTVTVPEPMGKQGRVLHPEQNRVVSVRECARSQGFPDSYRFCGSLIDKHRQIGNAVPPPMGAALGREIRKCMSNVEKQTLTPNEVKAEA